MIREGDGDPAHGTANLISPEECVEIATLAVKVSKIPAHLIDEAYGAALEGVVVSMDIYDQESNITPNTWAFFKAKYEIQNCIRDWYKLKRVVSELDVMSHDIPEETLNNIPLPDEDESEQIAISIDIQAALSDLNNRERSIIEDLYFNSRTLLEVGQKQGVSESYICQLKRTALIKLRAYSKSLT